MTIISSFQHALTTSMYIRFALVEHLGIITYGNYYTSCSHRNSAQNCVMVRIVTIGNISNNIASITISYSKYDQLKFLYL